MGLKDFIDKFKSGRKVKIEEGSWIKCERCKNLLYSEDLIKNLKICPHCGYMFRMSAKERVESLLDNIYSYDLFPRIKPVDIINFKDTKRYKDRLKKLKKTDLVMQ